MLTVAKVFGSNMVLQRQKNIRIWGTGDPGKTVKGILSALSKIEAITSVNKDGSWMITFSPQEAARNVELIITDMSETISFRNIGIGEVWLAGGQSNMEYQLEFDADKESVLTGLMNPDIRFFDYPEVSYEGQLEEMDYSRFGFWRTCTKEDLPYFSAVGYYFSDNLNEALKVPIGILGCNWGGTPACAWMDQSYLNNSEVRAWLDDYNEAVKNLDVEAYKTSYIANPMNDRTDLIGSQMMSKTMYPGLSREEQLEIIEMVLNTEGTDLPTPPQMGPYDEKRPGGLYETMLKKVAPFTIRGVIWYQGESDTDRADLYATVFSKMIQNWRDLWQEELPFLFVQLAPFMEWLAIKGERFPEIRRHQEWVSKNVPNTWMISNSDIGMEWDIHPKRKKPVGTRLALLARGHIYGENIMCDPPELKIIYRVEKGIQIEFENSDGLYLKDGPINVLEIRNASGEKYTPDNVIISNNGLLVCGKFPKNITISFAMTPFYEVNLYNNMDNPAIPFEVTI